MSRSPQNDVLRLMFAVPFTPRVDVLHGGRVVAQLLMRLAKRHRVALVHRAEPGSADMDPVLESLFEVVERVEFGDHQVGGKWLHRWRTLGAPRGVPTGVAPLRNSRFARACVELASSWEPDVIQVEHDGLAYCGPALQEGGSTSVRVLTWHDPGALLIQDQAHVSRGRHRLAHRSDLAGWRRYWSQTLPAFDAAVTFTNRDRERIQAMLASARIATPRIVPIGLGIDLPAEPLSATGRGEPKVLFIGAYEHPPNKDAAFRLVRSIMPEVRQRMPGLPLVLVGAAPGRELLDEATADNLVTGTVSSVTPFVDEAAVIALPIRIGGGMRVKLLEALAAGKAVVASPLAAAGLTITDGEELVLAETDHEFAEAIASLIADESARARLAHNAREWARENLSWEARAGLYEQLYLSLIASRAG